MAAILFVLPICRQMPEILNFWIDFMAAASYDGYIMVQMCAVSFFKKAGGRLWHGGSS
jgi:hypothetical protein